MARKQNSRQKPTHQRRETAALGAKWKARAAALWQSIQTVWHAIQIKGKEWVSRLQTRVTARLAKGEQQPSRRAQPVSVAADVSSRQGDVQEVAGGPEIGSDAYNGKRVRRSQIRRQEQQKKLRYVALGLGAVIVVAYLVLCGTVCREEMFPDTQVNGQDLSGMTLEQATEVLSDTFAKEWKDTTLTVTAAGEEYTVDMTKALELKADEVAERAFAHGHTGFFRRGVVWLFSHIRGYHKTVLPHIGDEAALKESVKATGLLKVDTAVADSYKTSKNKITFTRGVSGQKTNGEALYDSLYKAVEKGDYTTTIACPMTDSAPKALNIDQVYQAVYTKPVNATLDPDNDYAVVAAKKGVSFDKKEAKAAVEGLQEGESASISLTFTTADISTQKLKNNLFKDKLGSYSTNVAGTAARLNNVNLAAQHCNGTILLPGEVFSYNDVVGERTAARGFQAAAAYLNGQTVQELGGGICQVSSTLYCATVLANLEIVHRENHIFESTYVPLGLDATVSWGGPEYKFKNNTDYPIKVVATYYNGVNTCEIWGTKTDDITVKFTNEVLEKTPFSTVTVKDASQPQGYSAVTTTGENGYKVQTYRELYDGNGNLISKNKEAYSVYSKRDQVVTVGAKQNQKPKKKNSKKTAQQNNQ